MSTEFYYLAGPMRGIPEFGFPAFRMTMEMLEKAGLTIVSPHEFDEAAGFDFTGATGNEDLMAEYGFDISQRLAQDIAAIADSRCVGVILMPGWEVSSGARAEAAFAQAVGKATLLLVSAPDDGSAAFGLTAIKHARTLSVTA